MQTRLVAILLMVVCSCSLAACAIQSGNATPAQQEQIRQIGAESAKALTDRLIGQLNQALAQGGRSYALDFCASQAQAQTALVERDLGRGIEIKRTTLHYRNAANAPDSYEKEALRYFQDALASQGQLPADYIQFVPPATYRYYKPLAMASMCLQCHGDAAGFDEEFRQQLQARYPGDRATGYQEGDFRGVIRVSVPAALLE